MIEKLIGFSLRNRLLILLIAGGIFGWGWYSMQTSKIDAIPDLSENQVIVFTEWMGRGPQLVEDQVTYPLVTNLLGLPEVKYVRGSSMFGMSFIYIIFEDETDIYWARERVLERLSYASRVLPEGVSPVLGPDGTGVGHVLWYTLEAPEMSLGERRAVQDWYLKYALQTVDGVAEIASFGGFQRQYEIHVDPNKLSYYNIPLSSVVQAIRASNNESGGSKFEMSDMAYIIRTEGGYLKNVADLGAIPLRTEGDAAVRVRDVATIQEGGESRLGIFDLNGEGETVGGIVVMRYGENAAEVIEAVKAKMKELSAGLPGGMKFNIVYDRSGLIEESVDSVRNTIIEEMIVVALVVLVFLFHWRSAISILIQIPIAIAGSFILLKAFGITSNIMSLTGIALAIGVIVDNGIIMAENSYKHLAERSAQLGKGQKLAEKERLGIIGRACRQVSRGVFFSTLIIITSFLPVFLLTGQEGKLFHPLAYTKTFIMTLDAILVITLAPVLISYFMRGRFRSEGQHPVNRFLERLYAPAIRWVLKWRKLTLGLNILALAAAIPLLMRMGTEFMPPLDEGSILFMPVTLPDVSNSEIKRILQVQDRIIRSVPEVQEVLGKAGRASTATDNSPISMIETIIMLKPRSEWREGLSKEDIISELDAKLQIPGVVNGWTQPIINRINMLATGIRTDVGIKVFGQRLDSIQALSEKVRDVLAGVPGIEDLYVEPLSGGKYLDIRIDREQLGRYGLQVDDLNMLVESALGGSVLTRTVEGRARFPVTLRLSEDYRNSLERIRRIPVHTPALGTVPLSEIAEIEIAGGPPMINSDNAMLRGTVLFNVRGRDLGSTVQEARALLEEEFGSLPQGYFLEWSGQYENLIRGQRTLLLIAPIVLLVIFICLYLAFKSIREAFLNLITLPFALVGGVYMVYFWGVHLSIAVAVGFIALFGIAVMTGIVMVIYLNDAMRDLSKERERTGQPVTREDLRTYVIRGAAGRLRPKLMTVSVILLGLVPVLWAGGVGTDVMKPIVLPMIGGVITSSIHILLVTPLIFLMSKEYELRKYGKIIN